MASNSSKSIINARAQIQYRAKLKEQRHNRQSEILSTTAEICTSNTQEFHRQQNVCNTDETTLVNSASDYGVDVHSNLDYSDTATQVNSFLIFRPIRRSPTDTTAYKPYYRCRRNSTNCCYNRDRWQYF